MVTKGNIPQTKCRVDRCKSTHTLQTTGPNIYNHGFKNSGCIQKPTKLVNEYFASAMIIIKELKREVNVYCIELAPLTLSNTNHALW